MDLDAFRWLLTPEGQALLARATEASDGPADPMRTTVRLRREAAPEHVAAAMTQAGLRRKAEAKFGDLAKSMYYTPEGLEQATELRVAEHRAARIAAAAPSSVLDLGCGIGGDLLALSRAGLTAAGVDRDELRIAVASANLEALGLAGAARVADGTTLDLSGFGVVFADPARRNQKGRVFDVNHYSPSWSFVLSLLQRPSCVKVAPGIPHPMVPDEVEAEWVSYRGQVKEAALWSASLATTRRRATVIRATGLATLTDEDDPAETSPRDVGRFLYEPDGAVIRAGLVTAVATGVQGGLLDQHIAYVTSDSRVVTPFARGYEVVETLPYREKALRAALRERNIGRLTIMKRGVDVVPEELRKRLALAGDDEATVVLTRAAGRGIALSVRPL
ncbi:MAG TPA: class I SAM-dependent methyltransferase [Nocardioidaceae bacterium]|nr:class I SAM-dependent methyltransferase [Nocardioidaceae bacterium]